MVFIPTYLYIKQHTKTGKLYFGKSTLPESRLLSYTGSGSRWKRHIKIHGKSYVTTLWYQLYDNVFDLVADALSMSVGLDIVNSKSWMNLIHENGLDGTLAGNLSPNFGITRSQEFKDRISKMNSGDNNYMKNLPKELHPMYKKSHSIETKLKLSIANSGKNNPNYGKPRTDEFKQKVSAKLRGKPQSMSSILAKSKHYDFYIDSEYIIKNITIRQLCELFNLNYNSARNQFKKSNKYKNILKIVR